MAQRLSSFKRIGLRQLLTMSYALLALMPLSPSMAQEVEEVTVVGSQTEDATLDDLVSSAVLDAGKLADAGIENVEDVAAYVPNLVLSETSTGTNIVIRGIGAGVNQGFDQSVGLYIDGVPLPRSQMARAPFLDLSSVQVLRGPQYVKDGNYSLAGSVHMLSSEASDEFKVALDLNSIPSQNDRKALITLGMPIGDSASMRLALQRQRSDGYIENVTRNEDGPQRDNTIMRGVFSFKPTDDLSFKLKVERGDFNTKGRQIEILESQPTPDFRTFPEVQGPNGTILRGTSPNTNEKRGRSLSIQPELRNELDYVLDVIRSNYDVGYTGTTNIVTQDPVFAGYSYLQSLNNLYTDEQPVKFVEGQPTSNGPVAPPTGLLDSTLDYKRAANEAEFSNNKTNNYTLNMNYYLGDHFFALTASKIDYEVDELIDSDFTAVPILATSQNETYDQEFYKFEYKSPEDGFMSLTLGASFQDYELSFNERINVAVGGPSTQQEFEDYIRTNFVPLPGVPGVITTVFDPTEFVTFNPEAPFIPYFGRYSKVNIGVLQALTPDRLFSQEAETTAAYFESTLRFTDTFSATLGARYTRAKKAAIRDFAYLLKDGSAPFFPDDPDPNEPIFATAAQALLPALGVIFNFNEHTDRVPLSPSRQAINTEKCQNIVSFSLGGPCDDDPDSAPLDDEEFLPSLTLNWDINNDLSMFFSARMANKLGGFDARSVSTPKVTLGAGVQPGTFRFKDEDATTFEIGTKWYMPGGLGEMYMTWFHTTFKNLQVSTADRSVGFNVRNAGEARALGVEIEGLLQATEKLSVNYSLAWIDFQFTDFPFGSCSLFERPDSYLISEVSNTINQVFPLGSLVPIIYEPTPVGVDQAAVSPGFGTVGINPIARDAAGNFNLQRFDFRRFSTSTFCDFNGRTNQYVAEVQGTFSFNYENEIRGLGIFKPTLDVLYNSGYETTVTQDPDVAQDDYVQFNGRIALKSFEKTWEWALVGENLTNEKIVGFASEVPFATRIQGSKTHFGFIRPPRSIGINFRYNFY